MPRGRFAPSPTGALHLGNLRTALVVWLSACAGGGRVIVRMEDLDTVTAHREHAAGQLADLAALGLHHDPAAGPVVFQSERFALYRDAIADLQRRNLVYPCYCTRREIREAASAPHGGHLPDGAYPGTCRTLSDGQRRDYEREGRRAALRLRTAGEHYTVHDRIAGTYEGAVDDVVLQRNDGVPAYNLAVVVDDHLQAVTEVVRGDDLLSSTPRQLHLQRLLGFDSPAYAHVPLVIGSDGSRLAKRHGAVTLGQLVERGLRPGDVLTMLAESLGSALHHDAVRSIADAPLTDIDALAPLAATFDIARIDRTPWTPPVA